MTVANRPHNIAILQKSWSPVQWRNLVVGDVVAMTVDDQVVMSGTIDTFTFDKSVAWIFPSDSSERRMWFQEDDYQIWVPRKSGTQDGV